MSHHTEINQLYPEIGHTIKMKAVSINQADKLFCLVDEFDNISKMDENDRKIFIGFLENNRDVEENKEIEINFSNGQKTYTFKKDYYFYLKKNNETTWKTIIVTSNESYENYLKNPFNPLLLHGEFIPNSFENVRAARCISTYGCVEHNPSITIFDPYTNAELDGDEYLITDISSIIPNQKPTFQGPTNNTHLHLVPKKNINEDEGIFWYVDYTNKNICQFEDGCPIKQLGSIEIKSH